MMIRLKSESFYLIDSPKSIDLQVIFGLVSTFHLALLYVSFRNHEYQILFQFYYQGLSA